MISKYKPGLSIGELGYGSNYFCCSMLENEATLEFFYPRNLRIIRRTRKSHISCLNRLLSYCVFRRI